MDNPFSALESLCEVAAAVSAGASTADDLSTDVKEVEAFNSVHDMIHAAIDLRGGAATLQQIYTGCQVRGRITHRRTGGSRLITQNENWKCQIRHALYTAPRFKRCRRNNEYWTVGEPFAHHGYQTTTVVVAANEGFVSLPQIPCPSQQANSGGPRSPLPAQQQGSHGSARNYVRRVPDVDSDARSIFSRCPVLGVMIPRKPRSIRRTYILQHDDQLMLSEPESESPPKIAVMRDNVKKEQFNDIRDRVFNKPKRRFKCLEFEEANEEDCRVHHDQMESRSASPQITSTCGNTQEGCDFLLDDLGEAFCWKDRQRYHMQHRCRSRSDDLAYGDIVRQPIFSSLAAGQGAQPETPPLKALSLGFNISLSSRDEELSTSTSSDEPPCTSETASMSGNRMSVDSRIARALRERG